MQDRLHKDGLPLFKWLGKFVYNEYNLSNNDFSRSLILAIFLPLKNQIGAATTYLILFVLPMIFCLVFFYYMLPETKNRDLAEVEAEVLKLPRLPFHSRQCYQTNLAFEHRPSTTLPQKDVF